MDRHGDSHSLSKMADQLYSQPGRLLYTDITFLLSDGSEVDAHKLILALASPVFEMELYGAQWAERGADRVVIKDDGGVFKELISFIYKESVDFSHLDDIQLWNLLYLAHKYLINRLQSDMVERLKSCIKNCKHKPDLLDHWQRAKGVTFGDPFQAVIKDQIEIYAENVMSSEEFLKLSKEEAKEIMKYSELRVTEGQIFKYAVAWCLKNNKSEIEAERDFQDEFEKCFELVSFTSEDFIKNLLPHSQIMGREALKKVTKLSFENKTSGLSTRYALIPIKSISRVISQVDLHKMEAVCSTQFQFQTFDVEIVTRLDRARRRFECEAKFTAYASSQDWTPRARVGLSLKYMSSGPSGQFEKCERYNFNNSEYTHRAVYTITDLLNIDSELSIEVMIDARNVVPLHIMRQDIMPVENIESDSCLNYLTTVEVAANLTVAQATEVIKEKLNLDHVRLWYYYSSTTKPKQLCWKSKPTQKVGNLVLGNRIRNWNRSNYFLEVSKGSLGPAPEFMRNICMIHIEEENGPGSAKLIKDWPEQVKIIDEEFVATVKQSLGTHNENDYEIYRAKGDTSHNVDQPRVLKWKRQTRGKTLHYTQPFIYLFCPCFKKHQDVCPNSNISLSSASVNESSNII